MSLYESYWKNAAWWQRLGIPFTIFVIGLLVYLNLFGKVVVPQPAVWPSDPSLWICETSPEWIDDAIEETLGWWKKHGATIWRIERGPCPYMCKIEEREIPCKDGFIVLDLRDGALRPDHAGETLRVSNGVLTWSTILIPNQIHDSDLENNQILSGEVDSLVLAHEIGHALGYDHTYTDVGCGMHAEKTGHLMNSSLYDVGWGDEGLLKTGETQ